MLRGVYNHINFTGKLFLLVLLVFSFMLFSLLLGILVLVPFYDTNILGLISSPNYADASVVTTLKVIQIVNSVGGLLLPAYIYMWLTTPPTEKHPGFTNKVSFSLILLSILLIVISQPIIGWTNELNSHLTLPKWLSFIENWMKNKEALGGQITEAFLSTTSSGGLMVNVFMIAIIPAFAEEFLFRGALAKLLKDWTKNIHVAVFISSFIFAAIHMQFYGFLPRFLLGTALGYLFFWSGSLWLPIAAHFANNFLSVVVEFLFRKGYVQTSSENFGTNTPLWQIGILAVLVAGILYTIYKSTLIKRES
jgi:uncharacterized protein